jgi:hypothetical protein
MHYTLIGIQCAANIYICITSPHANAEILVHVRAMTTGDNITKTPVPSWKGKVHRKQAKH